MTVTNIIENSVRMQFSPEESGAISDMSLDYEQGIVSIMFRKDPDKVYFYDANDTGVLDCFEEASKDMEQFSMGKIFHHYVKDGELTSLNLTSLANREVAASCIRDVRLRKKAI